MDVRVALMIGAVALGCGETSSADPRFATPERTVETLLEAHGAGEASEAELRARVAEGGLRVVDRELFARCFADLDQPAGPALASYVLGMIAAARDALRYETIADRGYVVPRDGVRIVMRRGSDGAYRIVLSESVPEDVQRTLRELEGARPAPAEP
ncbi:MAG TPA: hypothetical protein VIL20_18110 [Sandaracinaceae bacterium]